MLIIFDLDDTLIDTSGSVTPFKMKECLKLLIKEGLTILDFEMAYQELLSINARSHSSQEALYSFLEKIGADSAFLEEALHEMNRPLPKNFFIPMTPNTQEILQSLIRSHTLVLVTGGQRNFQMEKLEKAGIDRSFFSKIVIPENSVKKPFYEQVLNEFPTPLEEVFCCGDRVSVDLRPAYELGLKTIHMRWGRGALTETPKWVDQSIQNLREMKRIVKI